MIMSHLADPGDDYDEFVVEEHLTEPVSYSSVTGNAGDAYQLGYEHGYKDGRLGGLAEARTVAQLLADGMTPEEAVKRVEHTHWSDYKAQRAAEAAHLAEDAMRPKNAREQS
jgi:hypothetical protein